MKKNNVSKNHDSLSSFEKTVLLVCQCLCNEEAVSVLYFVEVFQQDPHDTNNAIESLALKRRIRAFDGIIYTVFDHNSQGIPVNQILVGLMSRLNECTHIGFYEDRLAVKPYFVMGYSLLNYVLKKSKSLEIDYKSFGQLSLNLAEHIDLWCSPQTTNNYRPESLPIVRALNLTLRKISDGTIEACIHAQLARIYSNGWHYEKAMKHLSIAEDFDKKIKGEISGYTLASYGVYYWNFGQMAMSLKYFTMAADSDEERAYSSLIIALILALYGEIKSCRQWIRSRLQWLCFFSKYHELYILNDMVQALLADDNDSAFKFINRAELTLVHMSHRECPLGGLLYYVQSQLWERYGYQRKSLECYKSYVLNSLMNYHADGGGFDLFFGSVVEHNLNLGLICTAKRISIKELDPINIFSTDLSFSTRSQVCQAYIRLYGELKFFPLQETYLEMSEIFRKLYKPSHKTINFISSLFIDGIPEWISLDNSWEPEFAALGIKISMLEERQNPQVTMDALWNNLSELRHRYPERKAQLNITEARLLIQKDFNKGIEMFNSAINLASDVEYFTVLIDCARWLFNYGAIYESVEIYRRAIQLRMFQTLAPHSKFDFLLEFVMLLEYVGYRGEAQTYWDELEQLANEEQSIVLLHHRAVAEYEAQQYEESRLYLVELLGKYKQTETFDELLSSTWCYLSSIYLQQGEYENGLEAIKRSILLFPDLSDFDMFALYHNKVHLEILTHSFMDAQDTLKICEKYARSMADQKLVDELKEFLQDERTKYYNPLK